MKYQATIGLEIHAELRTKTKMFCASKNDPDSPVGEAGEKRPNVNICPVCVGHPGTLPAINEEAVRQVQRVGLALGGEVQHKSRFDRKNYFYPDLPKGYQISQYQNPLVWGGELHGVRITRVHLEEDPARSLHDATADSSLIDFNRSGVPLMELVTEPDITSAKQARAFAEELQLILQYIGASDANMEKGQMRCEANVSVVKKEEGKPTVDKQPRKLGTKVEIKNLNSFRAVERAIEYEINRQSELLERGEKVAQETRGWDENRGITFSQRAKESAHDYRYFPEPDLPPLEFSNEYVEKLRVTIPELPEQKRKRLTDEYKLDAKAVEILIKDRALAAFWEKVVSELREWFTDVNIDSLAVVTKLALNYFTSDFLGILKELNRDIASAKIDPENFAELVKMLFRKEISSRVAKDTLRHMIEHGGDPSTIVQDQGLGQVSDESSLGEVIEKIVSANPKAVTDYKSGQQNALQFLVGQVMKETKGAANPEVIRKLLTDELG